jgi:hypothetical protein
VLGPKAESQRAPISAAPACASSGATSVSVGTGCNEAAALARFGHAPGSSAKYPSAPDLVEDGCSRISKVLGRPRTRLSLVLRNWARCILPSPDPNEVRRLQRHPAGGSSRMYVPIIVVVIAFIAIAYFL